MTINLQEVLTNEQYQQFIAGERPISQGDMDIWRIDEAPADIKPEPSEGGNFILTHSETGHHHVVKETPEIEFYQHANDNNKAYLVVNQEQALVEHLRSHDTHETIALPWGIYEIRRQIESAPEGWRRAID